MDTSVDLVAFFLKGDNFCGFMLAFLHTSPVPFRKGVYSLRKEFAPTGSKSFP